MKNILQIILFIVLLINNTNAKMSEAKKLCDSEIIKKYPQKSVIKKQCSIVAKEYEEKKIIQMLLGTICLLEKMIKI